MLLDPPQLGYSALDDKVVVRTVALISVVWSSYGSDATSWASRARDGVLFAHAVLKFSSYAMKI